MNKQTAFFTSLRNMSRCIESGKNFSFLKKHSQGLILNIHVQPGSSQNAIAGVHGDAVKIKLTSPPVEGAANKSCIEFFSRLFKISKSSVEIISGEKSRRKRLLIKLDRDQDREKIYECLNTLIK